MPKISQFRSTAVVDGQRVGRACLQLGHNAVVIHQIVRVAYKRQSTGIRLPSLHQILYGTLSEKKEMALSNMRNFLDCPVMKDDNVPLTRYFDDYVPVEKEKTTRIRNEVLSYTDVILDYVDGLDKHCGKTGVRVGSSTQGLSVNVKGDV